MSRTKDKKPVGPRPDLPPPEFGNIMNDVDKTFRHEGWRKTKEWRIFVAGYNAAVRAANDSVMAKYDLGTNAEKLFGGSK